MRRWWGTLGRAEQVAVGSVVATLLVGLVSAVPAYYVFFDNGATTSTTTTTTTTTSPFPNEQERSLLAHLPKDLQPQCSRHRSGLLGERAGVVCVPSYGASKAWYIAFDASSALYQWYFQLTDSKSIARNSGNCHREQLPGEGFWTRGSGPNVGHLACYQVGQQVWMVWADTELRIGAFAYRPDLSYPSLYDWWTRDAGPDPNVR